MRLKTVASGNQTFQLFSIWEYTVQVAHVIMRNLLVYNIKSLKLTHKLDLYILIFNVPQLKYLYYSKMQMWVSNGTAY